MNEEAQESIYNLLGDISIHYTNIYRKHFYHFGAYCHSVHCYPNSAKAD